MTHAILAIVGIAALVVVIFFFRYLLLGAGGLLAWATHSGWIGVVIYIACWIFLAPLMVFGSIFYGYLLSREG